jgi:hypothetical protein
MPPRRKAKLSFDSDDDEPRTGLGDRFQKMEDDKKREAAESLVQMSEHDVFFHPEPIPMASSWEQYQAMKEMEEEKKEDKRGFAKGRFDLEEMEEDARENED